MTPSKASRKLDLPPGPRTYQIWRASSFQKFPVEAFGELWAIYGDIFYLPIFPNYRMVVLSHPRHAEYIFNRPDIYPKPDLLLKNMGLVQGRGLFTSEGEDWQRHRRLMQPAFQQRHLDKLHQTIVTGIQQRIAEWAERPQGVPVDIATEMTQLTLKIVSSALFSIDISDRSNELGKACRHAIEYVYGRISNPLVLPASWPTPTNLKFKQAKQTIDQVVQALIQARRRNSIEHFDLLSLLLAAQDEETGEGLSDQQLQDEMITLINAGHETSATTLAWIWVLLGEHPEVMQKLQAEVDEVLQGAIATPAHLSQLTYTRSVVDESLRLKPPALGVMRTAHQADQIDGYRIPKGTNCIIAQTNVFRHPEFWQDPDQFQPDRFLPEHNNPAHKYAYFPFGAGPHVCIGKNLALMELVLTVASVIQRFEVQLCPNQSFEIDPRFTLRPRDGVQVRLAVR